ncbi:MAG: phosphate acetyltransferase [Nostocoides sp.]
MATSIYLAGTDAGSGKSAVAVGLLDQVSRRAGRVGVFRPVVQGGRTDPVLDLLASRLPDSAPDVVAGVTYDDLHTSPGRAMERVVDAFHELAARVDSVLIVGTDFADVAAQTEFTVNADIAANLAAPMVLVIPSAARSADDVVTAARLATESARARHATVAMVVANQVLPSSRQEVHTALAAARLGTDAVALPDVPLLRAPTIADLMAACGGTLIHGDSELLDRECLGLVVAAMTMPHVLDRLVEGGVVVCPGDREEVLLATLLAHRAKTFPTLSGIVLNGGFEPSSQVARLIDGIDVSLPVVAAPGGTMATALALSSAAGQIRRASARKIEVAVGLAEEYLRESYLWERVDITGRSDVVTPLMFEHQLVSGARAARAHIVLPEGAEPRIIQAAGAVLARGIAGITLLGDEQAIRGRAAQLGVEIDSAQVVDPATSPWRGAFATEYARLRAHKGVTADQAADIVADPSYFGTLMVHLDHADGMVSGSITTTAATVRPALEIVRTAADVAIVSSVFFMCLPDRVLVYGDCAINPDPTAEQLADIAISSARTARLFGIEPRIAMLSYSTGASGTGADVDKVRTATGLVHDRAPGLLIEGPIQYDAAVDPSVGAAKLGASLVAGRANVLIFPDLNTGNNTYKAVQRSALAVAIGPILQGLGRPINDLSRGALVRDIVNTVAITAIQAGRR